MTCHTLAACTCAVLWTALLSCPTAGQGSANKGAPTPMAIRSQTATLPPAIPEPLAVEEAVRIGVARNPQTAAGVAGVASAAANYKSLTAFPSLQLGVTRAQGTSTAPTLNGNESDTFIDLGEVLDTSGQRRYQAAGARAQLGATRYQLDETKLSLEQQIRDAYWSLAAAQALTQYNLESLQEAQRVNKLVHTQQEAGAAPQVDVIRSSIDVANAQQAYITAQGAERSALAAFNLLLVRPPTAPIKLADNIEAGVDSKAATPSIPDLAALTRSALANRALVKSAIEQVHVADYAVKQTRASRFPDLSVDYERSLQQTTDTVLLNVRFPLLDFGSTSYSVKAAEETRKQATAQKEQAEQQVIQQVAQAYQDITQAQALLVSYLTDILNPSTTLRDMAQLGYKQGATGILPVIDAETTLRNARTGYVNSLLAVHKALDELNAALGVPAPH
ncbi:MAG TPA: TolC family protein [Chthonomonadaceae bacterium]|nr:TolC family protein [Chthonomonadaceae bacterium]